MSLTGFTTPLWFLLLVVVAALAVGYVWMQRRRRRQVLRFANLAMLERVAPKRQGWWRHLPVALLLAALVLFTLALTGPTAEQKVPRNRATVLLVIDVSLSMRSTDVVPTRADAASAAVRTFVDGVSGGTRLAIVSFSSAASVVQPLTDDKDVARDAIGRIPPPNGGTAIGDALATAARLLPATGRRAIVLVTDGTTFEEKPRGASGHPTAPLSDAELRAKFLACAAPVIGADAAEGVADQIAHLEDIPDIRALTSRLTGERD